MRYAKASGVVTEHSSSLQNCLCCLTWKSRAFDFAWDSSKDSTEEGHWPGVQRQGLKIAFLERSLFWGGQGSVSL